MTVTILRPLEMAEAGSARMLHVGQVVTDLPDVVAARFVSRGWAPVEAPREVAAVAPPETGRQRRGR